MASDQKDVLWSPSPNYWASRAGHSPLIIVAHGTAGASPGCVNWLCDPQSGASAHYVVDRAGKVYQLVREDCAAWANGIPEPPSPYTRGPNPNLISLSIEAERPDADNTTPLTDVQIAAITRLVTGMRAHHGPLPLIPHSTISPQSRARCPGPGYPLEQISTAAQAASGTITWTNFTGQAQHLPLVFYNDPSFKRPLYRSSADAHTPLTFDAWQPGEIVVDPVTKQPDGRWFHRHNAHGEQGWTPSAWINGGPG